MKIDSIVKKSFVFLVAEIAFVLVFCGWANAETNVFAGGDGTKDAPWQITTPEQLDAVRKHLGGNFILTADIDLSGYANWEPIGIFRPLSEKPEDAEAPDPSVAFR